MSLKKTSASGHSTLHELNITPLLDLVFVLLVIFIITTPQMTNNLEMALPSAKPPPQLPDPKPKLTRIAVGANGQTSMDGEVLALPTLKQKLQGLKSAESDLRVVVKAEDEAAYQNVVNLLDLLRQLEITKVGLATAGPTLP
jgi:biopolymer transport protein ExbD